MYTINLNVSQWSTISHVFWILSAVPESPNYLIARLVTISASQIPTNDTHHELRLSVSSNVTEVFFMDLMSASEDIWPTTVKRL